MSDPVKRPLSWSKAYPTYAERHDMYRVFQELLKELIIEKPLDPLIYIRDELKDVARLLHAPRVFMVGPNVVTQSIGRDMASKTGSKFLTLSDIVESSPDAVRDVLTDCVKDPGKRFDDSVRKLLVAAIKIRLRKEDCMKNGYILYGFPQNRQQTKISQQNGLLPRQVFILLTGPVRAGSPEKVTIENGLLPEMGETELQEVADGYDSDICKVVPYEKWSSMKKHDVETEMLADLVSIKPCGSPWIPKILIIGPPSSGRSTVASELCEKFAFVNVDFIELVRGVATLDDEVAKGCKKYLDDLQPMDEELVKRLLKRRLTKTDCERKGWILHGFPDTAEQLKILEMLQLAPNRVFLLYCPDEVCIARLEEKRHEVLNRKLLLPDPMNQHEMPYIDENNFRDFPFGKESFRSRFQTFAMNLATISEYFGSQMIYVDATQKLQDVIQFMRDSVHRPPMIRYPDPNAPAVRPPRESHAAGAAAAATQQRTSQAASGGTQQRNSNSNPPASRKTNGDTAATQQRVSKAVDQATRQSNAATEKKYSNADADLIATLLRKSDADPDIPQQRKTNADIDVPPQRNSNADPGERKSKAAPDATQERKSKAAPDATQERKSKAAPDATQERKSKAPDAVDG